MFRKKMLTLKNSRIGSSLHPMNIYDRNKTGIDRVGNNVLKRGVRAWLWTVVRIA